MIPLIAHRKAEEETYSGLLLQHSSNIGIEKARVQWEKSILDEAKRQGVPISSKLPFLTITMPCGTEVHYQTFSDIPTEDTPCPCGDKRHWLVRYSVFEAER